MSHWTAWSLWTVLQTGVYSSPDKNKVTGLPGVASKVGGVKKKKKKKMKENKKKVSLLTHSTARGVGKNKNK